MKKYWIAALIALALIGLVRLNAVRADVGTQGGEISSHTTPIRTVLVKRNTDSVGDLGAGSVILGFKTLSASTSSGCILYDAATVPTDDTGIIDELTDPTALDVNVQMWPHPVKLVTDLSVRIVGTINTTSCIVYYL